MKTTWLPPQDHPAVQYLVAAGYDRIVAQALVHRGITTAAAAEVFTEPVLGDIHKAALLPDIAPAVALLKRAIAEGWSLRLITDYDMDGIGSGALFYLFLRDKYRQAGHDPDLIDVFTPNRFSEGYGLNKNHILGAAMDGKKLLMTFDCGIRSHEEGDLAREMGLHLIITDHHEPPEDGTIPHADAVINPKRHDSLYPFKEICGCVVGLKVAWAIEGSLKALLPYFDLAAVATIADMMPMHDENRAIVKYGMAVLNGEPIMEGDTLIYPGGSRRQAFGLLTDFQTIQAEDVGFKIGPPLNALGRMGNANRGVAFLTEEDGEKLLAMKAEIDAENELRKELQNAIVEEICAQFDPEDPPAAIVYCDTFERHGEHAGKVEGIVGIAAGKVGETFGCPAIILAQHGSVAKGSARAITSLDLHHTLAEVAPLLLRWGGHQAAAGLSLKPENVPLLREHLTKAAQTANAGGPGRRLQVDAIITEQHLRTQGANYPIMERFDLLRPFGKDCPQPLLQINGAQAPRYRAIGKDGSHLKLTLRIGTVTLDAVHWRGHDRFVAAGAPECLDLVGRLSLNTWNNRTTLQFMIEDWRPTEECF